MNWDLLGSVPPQALVAARKQAHWSAQIVAAVGETHAPHREDTSHTAMVYRLDLGGLAGAAVAEGLRAALWIPELALGLLRGEEVVDHYPLEGRTLPEAAAWMSTALEARSRGRLTGSLVYPEYELEPHGLRDGDPFVAAPAALQELDRWFANAQRTLAPFATTGDGPTLCWPHHFDIATLRTLESLPGGGATKTVGVGLSPGDSTIPKPYWYVNHWPARDPAEIEFGDLPFGTWHTDGFVAAILTGSEIVEQGDAEAQASALGEFLQSAVRLSEELIR